MDDWIRLLVKYKGKCSACGKEITAGQYALWSKSSKAIKHSECNTTTNSSQTVTTEKKQVDMNRQRSMVAKVDCFICSRPVARKDSEFVESDSYGKQSISQASICNECLKDKNAYQNYQYAFIERVRKVAKVKTWA
jgi:hypothetical protein